MAITYPSYSLEDTMVRPRMTTGGTLPADPAPSYSTGGPLPPEVYIGDPSNPPPTTGGPLPPDPVQTPQTGGPLPPDPVNPPPQTGGGLPPIPLDNTTAGISNLNQYVAQLTGGTGQQTTPNQVVQQALAGLLDQNGSYIRNARQNGLDLAARRGLVNSSIAAGNSEKAAIEAVQPLVNQVVGINNNRENMAFTGQQNQLNRIQSVNNAALEARLTDWLSGQNFTRQFNGQLAMMPITNAFQLSNAIAQYALENPEVYTPSVVSSLNNFFNQNMFSILQQYFPNMVQQTQGGSP